VALSYGELIWRTPRAPNSFSTSPPCGGSKTEFRACSPKEEGEGMPEVRNRLISGASRRRSHIISTLRGVTDGQAWLRSRVNVTGRRNQLMPASFESSAAKQMLSMGAPNYVHKFA
jgi:hypothetical protein